MFLEGKPDLIFEEIEGRNIYGVPTLSQMIFWHLDYGSDRVPALEELALW